MGKSDSTPAPDSNMLHLKVRELLNEVQLGSTQSKAIDLAVSKIKDCINQIPAHKVGADAIHGFVRDIRAPAEKIEFTFRKPEFIEVVGSYSMNTIAKPHVSVDMLLRMPKGCFLEQDVLNYRYHAKRCLYLSVIEKHLRSSSGVHKTEWSPFQNEARKPVLVVYPDLDLNQPFQVFIRLIPTATSFFNVAKLDLKRNNIRTLKNKDGTCQATPKYNSSILEDMFLEVNASFVKNTFAEWPDLREALLMLKVWARQRMSIYSHDGLNGFLNSIILSYLASACGGNIITRSMNALQIFRVVLNFLATSELWDEGFSLQHPGKCRLPEQDRQQYMQLLGVILYDVSGHYNLAFRMRKNAIKELRDEAMLTLRSMQNCEDGFEELFMTKVDFAAKFDYCIRLDMRNNKVHESGYCHDDECWILYEDEVHSLLERGLGNRAKFIRVLWNNKPSKWDIKNGLSELGAEKLFVGVLLSDFDVCFRMVDIGPNAGNKEEVLKFRKFWGDKAELRRFKDGTIAECTVWECSHWERHLILKRIAEFVLCRHLSISKEDMEHIVDQLDFTLSDGVKDPIAFSGSMIQAFDKLSRCLRDLEDVPLKVCSVQPLDSALRQTAVFPPVPHPLAFEEFVDLLLKDVNPCIRSLDVMIQLEGSGNWPLGDTAIEKTKFAFLLKIGESLERRWGLTCIASEEDVNILLSGYSFHLTILHERNLHSIKRQVKNDQSKEDLSLDKELYLRAQHTSMINSLRGRYPMYGPVVRIAKRWITSHLFSSCLKEEAVELIVAYLFLKPFPFSVPCSRITGFLRFLRLLSSYDWSFYPMIVDINNDLSLEDERKIHEHFMFESNSCKSNAASGCPAVFLATSYDKTSEAWTRKYPNRLVLKRIVAYARSSEQLFTSLILQNETGLQRWEGLFRTPLHTYDAIVLLHTDKLSFPHYLFPVDMDKGKCLVQGKSCRSFTPCIPFATVSWCKEEIKAKLLVNFDPTWCFIQELKEFEEKLKVWYDSLGGDVIGLTWEKSKKRRHEDASRDAENAINILKKVGLAGKGLVKGIYSMKDHYSGV